MTGSKDVSIKIGNVTLSTANIPKGGIDLNKLNENTKNALSIFDSNDDGILSAKEIKDTIVKLESADETHSEVNPYNVDQIITTKKNGILEDVELNNLEFMISLTPGPEIEAALKELKTSLNTLKQLTDDDIEKLARKNGWSTQETRKKINELITRSEISISELSQTKVKANSYQIKEGAKVLQRTIVAENEIRKNGLQRTYNDNWLKDSNGGYYRYNEETMKFEKIDNVEYVGKDGSYRTRNANGQKIIKTANGKVYRVLNNENKAYINGDYAAKVAGLEKFGDGYKAEDGSLYVWDNEKHCFIETPSLIKVSF